MFGWAFWVHVCGAWMCGVGVLWCFKGVGGSVCCLGVSVCVCVWASSVFVVWVTEQIKFTKSN